MSSWHSYPSVYALGHRYVTDLLLDDVIVQEKIDGSQFSFGKFVGAIGGAGEPNPEPYYLRMRSKGAEINVLAPEKMFTKAVEYVYSIFDSLTPGWTYRGEYLAKPKHNALAYDRVPKNNIILFDINDGEESYLSSATISHEAERLGFEAVPCLFEGKLTDVQQVREMLNRTSCLGGQKIEGVVVKSYHRFGLDKKVLMGKFVSEEFKEVHNREWKAANPGKMDIVQAIVDTLRTPARWNKAIQHLAEAGKLENDPRDIGLLFREVPDDIVKEEVEFIKDKLFEWAWPHIKRGVTAGIPEWYKERLLKLQFETEETDGPSNRVTE